MNESTKLLMIGLRNLEGEWTAAPRAEIAIKLAQMRAEMGPRYRKLLIRFGSITERVMDSSWKESIELIGLAERLKARRAAID
jgi:hypothetical protein